MRRVILHALLLALLLPRWSFAEEPAATTPANMAPDATTAADTTPGDTPPADATQADTDQADVGTVTAIHFVGNKKTQETLLLQEMSIHVGDAIDAKKIAASRQAIMNLGLFKSVTAAMEGSVLVITVVERFYILPFPLLDVRPTGDYSYGAELRLDNLAGLNQRLKLTYQENANFNQSTLPSKQVKLNYSYPRLIGTPYQLDVSSQAKRSELYWPDNKTHLALYQLDDWSSSLGASRWVNDNGESRGWRYGGAINHEDQKYTLLGTVPGTFTDGQAVSLSAALSYVSVNDYAFYREGRTFGMSGELAAPWLGSDFNFSREQLFYRSYRHIASNGANINSQWLFGFANGCSFGCAAYSLGGANSLRGYDNDYVTGNVFVQTNLEYHYPLSGFRQLRGVVFTDIGDAWTDLEAVSLGKLKSSVGVGMRWTVQSFVNLTLRVDYGYAVETGRSHAYFSTSASF